MSFETRVLITIAVSQDTPIPKDKNCSREGPEIEIAGPMEDTCENSQQTDTNSRWSLENDLKVTLSDVWDEGDSRTGIRLFEDNGQDESYEKTLISSTEEAGVPAEASWITWAIIGVSGIFLAAGLLVLWNLSASFFGPRSAITENIPDSLAGHRDLETMNLAPFLIPAQRNKETIFFKLQVELVVSDAETKHAIRKKEAWVRDIIYRELKGIDVGSGIQENLLIKYRRPIVSCLNRELAPLRVEDIRLKGYLMKQ
ncbi:MAG: hypothetical protein C4B57_06785 [Deltaproteobacteria bacterium]|nr:MAG: hypothetical protein C4B57_06785 [Deltaproteobacteria bacterium]